MKPAKSRKQLELIATALAVHVERWPWRQLIASDHGPRSATTRYVLHMISLFMSDSGGNCYPSQAAIARRACLTTRAVKKHIAIAKRSYWLDVTERYSVGQSWRRNSYAATVPAALHPLIQRVKNGDTRALWITSERGEQRSPGWGTTFPPLGNDVPINLIRESDQESVLSVAAVGKSAGTSRPRAPDRSKDDLKNRSRGRREEVRDRALAALVTRPAAKPSISDDELAAKVRKLRAIGQSDADIRRTLGSQASSPQVTRVLKSRASR